MPEMPDILTLIEYCTKRKKHSKINEPSISVCQYKGYNPDHVIRTCPDA